MALVAVALLGTPAFAATARTDESALEPIIVTPDEPRTGDVVVEDHVGTHTRIAGERLARRELALDDVLAQEAGVQRRRSGGLGTFSSITVRAASPAQTAVLLDGVRLNSAGAPVIDLSTLELLALERIDVYRGVTPLQFGAGAIGGAVDLVTPRVEADGEPRTTLGLGVASFGTARAEAARLARHGRWDTVATFAATRSDNAYPFVDGNGTPLNPADDRRERRENAAVERVGLLAKLGTGHGARARSDLLLQLGERRLGVPEWRNAVDNDARFDTGTRQLQFTHARDGVARWDTRHTLFAHAADDRFEDRDGDVGLGTQDTLTRARSTGLSTYWTRALDSGTVDATLDARRETLASRDRISTRRDVDARRHTLVLGARWARYAADGRLVVAPALRWEASDDRFDAAGGRLAEADGRRRASTLLPEIGLRLDASDTFTLHASLGRHSREPAFDELFVDRGLVQGNPALVAERGTDADVGLEWADGAFETAITAFASERDELIATVHDARGVGRAVNTGRARVTGLELSGGWTPAERWRVDANATWQDARTLSDNPVLDGRQIPGEARLQWHAALRWRPTRRWRLRLEVDASRERFYDSANILPARDATVTRLGVEHRRGDWRVDVAIDNLGDDNVEDFNGFPRPGRAFSLHVTTTL